MRMTRRLVLASVLIPLSALAQDGRDVGEAGRRGGDAADCAAVPAMAPATIDRATSRRIDALFADFRRSDTPGYAVGVAQGGQLIYAQGFGQANLDDTIPIARNTAFHLASLSKQFTGAAVALLLLDNKISLEDPVGKYIPAAAKYGSGLRIKHLVCMTSGIGEYTGRPRLSGLPWFTDFYFTCDEAIAAALLPPTLDFSPGQKWSYSNIDYMLLTQIVETVSGQRFSDFMRQRVFAPLCMRDTHIDDDTTQVVPHRAIGYARRSAEVVDAAKQIGVTLRPGNGYARMLRVSPHFGGSGVFSSLEDLARWNDAFAHPRLGGAAFAAQMQQFEQFEHDKKNDAFGLVYGEYAGRPMWWYSGGDIDGSSYMARFPHNQVTVICLSNIHEGDCEGRAKKVLDVLNRANGRWR